jgi:plastocyanin
MRRVVLVALVCGVTACGGGDGGTARPDGPAAVVEVHDNTFSPLTVSVAPGATVEWRWTGGSPHNVTGDGLVSATQSTGVYRHTFARAGRYPYQCTLHAHMLGEVMVR